MNENQKKVADDLFINLAMCERKTLYPHNINFLDVIAHVGAKLESTGTDVSQLIHPEDQLEYEIKLEWQRELDSLTDSKGMAKMSLEEALSFANSARKSFLRKDAENA